MTQYKKVASSGRTRTNDADEKNLACVADSLSSHEVPAKHEEPKDYHSICHHGSRAMHDISSPTVGSSTKDTGDRLSSRRDDVEKVFKNISGPEPGVSTTLPKERNKKIGNKPNPVQVLAIGRSRRRKKNCQKKKIQGKQTITFNKVGLVAVATDNSPEMAGGRRIVRKQRQQKTRQSFVKKQDGGIKAQTQPKRMVHALLPSIDGTRSIPRLLKDEESRRKSVERILRSLGVMKDPLGTSRRASMPTNQDNNPTNFNK